MDVQEVFELLPRQLPVVVDVVAREDSVHLVENCLSQKRGIHNLTDKKQKEKDTSRHISLENRFNKLLSGDSACALYAAQ